MSVFFADHLDFIFLIYGLAFLLLAVITLSMSRIRRDGVPWHWLGSFGVIHGLNEWIDMVLMAHSEFMPLYVLRNLALMTSYVCLMEFGRRAVRWSRGRTPGLWIYGPSLILIILGMMSGLEGHAAMSRFALAFPGGVLSAYALWQWSVPEGEQKRLPRRVLLAVAMVMYGIVGGLVFAKSGFWLSTIVNGKWFWELTGIPIQLVRCGLACIMVLALWQEHRIWRQTCFVSPSMKDVLTVEKLAVVIAALILAGSWMAGEEVSRNSRDSLATKLLDESRLIALSLDTRDLHTLSISPDDLTRAYYRKLAEQLQSISETVRDVRYVYLMGQREGKILFMADVEPRRFEAVADKPNASPGDVYKDAPSEILRVFKTGKPVVSEPYSDEWGSFVSVFYPVTAHPSGPVLAVLGMDVPGAMWALTIQRNRLAPLLVSALVVLLFMTLIAMWRNTVEVTELKRAAAERLQQQQSVALWISNSVRTMNSDEPPPYREVLKLVGEALQVDRAEAWAHHPAQGQFRVSGCYSLLHKVFETGAVIDLGEFRDVYELLMAGRVWAVDDCGADTRLGHLGSWFRGQGVRSVILAPYHVSGEMAGVLVLSQTTRIRRWQDDEVRFASEVAGQIAHLLANAQRNRAEKALRKMNNELEIRVEERTSELSRKNAELYHEMVERLRAEEDRRKLEVQIQQAQKYESLGLMAGGIAHDFNNILMAIRGNVELARLELPQDASIQDYLRDVDSAAARAATLSRQMLAFSGRGHTVIQGVDLNAQVQDMIQILEVTVGKKARVHCQFAASLPPVDGDPSQIGQIVMNLAINAAEAIGDKPGDITIRTGTLDDGDLSPSVWMRESLPPGRTVFVEVADTGCGMDEATQKRMFDPFFTTKFTGRGLGLATVMGIVKGHRGAMEVRSELGKGTTIRVIFPEGHLEPVKKDEDAQNSSPWRSGGTILVVDDEEPIRVLSKRMLERLGYKALVTADGAEAIRLFGENKRDICCVLLDLTMPGKDGREVFGELRQIDPAVRIIVCSGFNQEDVAARFGHWKLGGFLQKPYTMDSLFSCLNTVMRQ